MSDSPTKEGIGVCFPVGFEAAGIHCGIKSGQKKDLAIVYSKVPAQCAGVFTTNKVKAAPVLFSMPIAKVGRARAVLITSGNANVATGPRGAELVEAMAEECGNTLGFSKEEALIAQTGLIGIPLDKDLVTRGVRMALPHLSSEGGSNAAEAILTTDTRIKLEVEEVETPEGSFRIGAMAKGAAMLYPSMATMLATITTDATASAPALRAALKSALPSSFHAIVVDGSCSTNDTVFLLANGESGLPAIDSEHHRLYPYLEQAVTRVCRSLAKQMIRDAEGAKKFLTMRIFGAASQVDASIAARAVASSILVKCSLAGEDPYWGRVLCDLGASGAELDQDRIELFYGNLSVFKDGQECDYDRQALRDYMKNTEIEIAADFKLGPYKATSYGCDLSYGYLEENMGTS